MSASRRAVEEDDYLRNSLSQLAILADDKVSAITRRALIRNSDDDLVLSLKLIFVNLVSGHLTISDPGLKESIGRSTYTVAQKLIAPKRPGAIRTAILCSAPACLKAFALVLPVILDEVEDIAEVGLDQWLKPTEADSPSTPPPAKERSEEKLQTPPLPEAVATDFSHVPAQ